MSDPAAVELADLADSVLREVIEVRRRYEELERVLGLIEPVAERGAAPHRPPERRPRGVGARDRNSKPNLGAARSIARTAALSGASRREVEAYLREELGVQNSAAVLDEVFGPDAPPGKRKR